MRTLATTVLEELWFGEDNVAATDAMAAGSLTAKLAQLDGLKPFPVVVQRLIECVSRDDFTVDQVRRLIEEDPAMASRVLRVANSVAFQTREPCSSIQDAIIRLGARTLSDLAAAMASMAVFKDLSGAGSQVRDHCAATAAIVRVLAYRTAGVGAPALAFLAGLLHDLGKLLMLQVEGQSYGKLVGIHRSGWDEIHVTEREVFGFDHGVLAGHVLRSWGLPEPLPKIVAWHHQPARAYAEGGSVAALVAVLRLGDLFDAVITADTPIERPTFEKLADRQEAVVAGFDANDLAGILEESRAVRADTVLLFR